MPQIIKNRAIVDDNWIHVDADASDLPEGDIPEGDIIVPLGLWQDRRSELLERSGRLGVRLAPDQQPSLIADDLSHFDVVAFEFPAFKDGRAFSHARVLRERYGYKGEVRAVGDVARDQIFFMARCGFDAYEVKEGRSLEDALKAFEDFSVTYQPAADDSRPFFLRS